LFISSEGELIGRHRKTVPSYTERFWWTNGDGTDLVTVDMPGVGRVCALLCWEAYMALARYTLYAQGCEFLVIPTQDIGPVWTSTASFIAREGRVRHVQHR
jgi:nitrilase